MPTADTAPTLVSCLLPRGRTTFGRYTLLYSIASGGMANLFAAKLSGPDGFEKLVAIKIMHRHLSRQPEFVRMFIDEARLASRVSHPNVVQILELGKVDSSHFMAMEYVDGESVLGVLRRTRFPFAVSVQVVAAAALGLHAAHELRDARGALLDVVHRDVSPDNILIGYDGSVKIADFGVARVRGSLHTTRSGAVKGKLSYMAPEQALGRRLDRRADLFSLGIVLYEMTTGRRLFRRPTDAQVLQAVIRCRVPVPSTQRSDYPKALEGLVMKALRRNPDGRFQTALELHQALAAYLLECSEPLTSARLGQTMTTLFADRIRRKRELLRRSPGRSPSVPRLDVDNNSVEMQVCAREERPQGRRALERQRPDEDVGWSNRAKALLGVGVGLLAVVLALGLRLGLRQAAELRPPAPGPSAVRAVARPLRPLVVDVEAAATPDAAAAPSFVRRVRVRRRRVRRRRTTLSDRDVLHNPYQRRRLWPRRER